MAGNACLNPVMEIKIGLYGDVLLGMNGKQIITMFLVEPGAQFVAKNQVEDKKTYAYFRGYFGCKARRKY